MQQYHSNENQTRTSHRSLLAEDDNSRKLSNLRLPLASGCPVVSTTTTTTTANSRTDDETDSSSSSSSSPNSNEFNKRRKKRRQTSRTFRPVMEDDGYHFNSTSAGLKQRLSPRATTNRNKKVLLHNSNGNSNKHMDLQQQQKQQKSYVLSHSTCLAGSSDSSSGSGITISLTNQSGRGYLVDTSKDNIDDKYKQRTTKTMTAQKTLLYIRINMQVVLEALLLIGILLLLWDFHSNKLVVNQQINQLQQEKKTMLLQVNEIAKSSLRLHQKFSQVADHKQEESITESLQQQEPEQEYRLIRKRMTEFQDQEKQLNDKVDFMRSKIQHSAKRKIQTTFGTGPIKVVLELTLGDYKFQTGTPLSILLFVEETPHAVWMWLEQIQLKMWDGIQIGWERDQHLDFMLSSQQQQQQLDFPEMSKHSNKAWTLCAKNNNNKNAMQMYLNIQGRQQVDPEETCFGIVVDSSDTIRELLFETQRAPQKVTVRRTYVQQQQ